MKIKRIYASTVAKLDSNVHTGGGSDDTQALQAVLDMAIDDDVGVHLIMDGAALISQLKLYSNTTIECMNKDCGFYQIDWVNQPIIKNVCKSPYEMTTRNITLSGGTYNHNGQNQEHDINGDLVLCILFQGVEHLTVKDLIIRDFRTFAFTVHGFKCVTVENVWLDLPHGTGPNQDGFHFWGPGQFLNVLNCGGKVGDDIINVGPDEIDKKSSITDVLIDGIFIDDGEQAIRLLSRADGILDRVTIRNVSGVYRSYGFYIDPWFPDNTFGNFKNIYIENVDLKANKNTYNYHPPVLFSIAGNVECMTLKNIRHHNSADNRTLIELGLPFYNTHPCNYADMQLDAEQKMQNIIIDGLTITEHEGEPENTNYISIYDKVENLVVKNVIAVKEQSENSTLIHFDKKGCVENLIMESIYTKGLKTLIDDETKIKCNLKRV